MSDDQTTTGTKPWVPSPEQPSPGAGAPTTTEFDALVDAGEAVPRERTGEQIGASAGPAVEAPPVVEGAGAAAADGGSDAPGPLGGLLPPDRPELVVAVAFAGGVLAAILLRSLVRR